MHESMIGMENPRRRRALLAGYLTAAAPFLIGCAWDLIFQYRVAKTAPPSWIVDSAPPYLVQFLIPIGFFGFIAFALIHCCVILFRKFSN
jgi:hypothetical protein